MSLMKNIFGSIYSETVFMIAEIICQISLSVTYGIEVGVPFRVLIGETQSREKFRSHRQDELSRRIIGYDRGYLPLYSIVHLFVKGKPDSRADSIVTI